jgi:hypothetical protein
MTINLEVGSRQPPHPLSRTLLLMRRFLPVLFILPALHGQAKTPDFTQDILPIFQQHCLDCHGPDKQSGGMRFDQRHVPLAGGDSGTPAITPRQPELSQMLQRLSSASKDDQMPPKGERLEPEKIALLRQWIAAGAAWPESDSPAIATSENRPVSTHWSFQPLTDPVPPDVKNKTWPLNPIDRFILARLEAAGLTPVPEAAPAALLRRATYDLTGLPPSPQEVRSVTTSPNSSYQALISRLLESPRYGERWGRHWMDWVRYADTAGDNSDYPIPQAYLYRNYIIQSFNSDVPYDRFLTEQIAGDLLPADNQEEKNRLTIATGYLAMARRFGSLVERYPQHLTIEDTLDNLGRTVMGLTLSCARCHDHKFDPISTRDYYGMYGIFASTRYPMPGLELFQAQNGFVPLIPEKEASQILQPYQKETTRLNAEMENLFAACQDKAIENARREQSATLDEQRHMKGELNRMLLAVRKAGENLARHLKTTPVIPSAYAVQDRQPVNSRIQIKGEPDRPGAQVPRKFLDILGGHPLPPEAAQTSGRLQLAQWLTHTDNPLTARVIVNRIWQRHFGKGLVATPSDFGLRGEPPSHPELLDWLARDFIRSGWSIKHLHRLIMTSRTYRLSSQDREKNLATDPSNTLHWKFSRQRLDAEAIRDTLLLVSGALDPTPQTHPYPIPPAKDWKYTQHHPFKDDYPSNKRSVYLMTKRLTAKPYFQTFDGADANVCTTTRDSSVTALQALYFVNDTFVHEQARLTAQNLLANQKDDPIRLHHLFLTLLSRPPADEETALLLTHLQTVRQAPANDHEAWSSLTRSLFRLNEFLYLD